ncbi:hypothetical protein DL89DRAFT_270255 [Linderina pennispora]|uniref:Uncharacterized protein n=1 Tax=Linderina pennispora TaxID=61395 RepID=A0A1Y1VZ84_9FUNG|nr:uncharacterized protein DL89DRAFT_270255 [Linderina pennispora]ORX66335.1 hypothetical protein DL89DRAFT_270255 [Linderina pennispora]
MATWVTSRPFILKRVVAIYRQTISLNTPNDIDGYILYLQLNQVCQCRRGTI